MSALWRARERFQGKAQPHVERPDIPHEHGEGRIGLLASLQETQCRLIEHRSRSDLFNAKAAGETLIPKGIDDMAKMGYVLGVSLVADRSDPTGFPILLLEDIMIGGSLCTGLGRLSALDDRLGPGSFIGWQILQGVKGSLRKPSRVHLNLRIL
jgi:hypothetical protein